MKRGVIVFVMLLFNNFFMDAQEQTQRFSIQTNPLMLLTNITWNISNDRDNEYRYWFNLEFQYKLSNYWNVLFRTNFLIGNSRRGRYRLFESGDIVSHIEIYQRDTAITFMPGVMFRPFGTGLRGMYIGLYPNIGWQNVNRTVEQIVGNFDVLEPNDNFFIIGIGAEIGYVWIFRSGFTISLGGGYGRNWGISMRGNSGILEVQNNNTIDNLRVTLLMGYSF